MMEEVQNRNLGCNCNNSMNYTNTDLNTITNNLNNMFANNMYNNNDNCENNEMTKEHMLKQIKCYQFAIIELALYLDTHPDDERALCLHRKYARELKDLQDKYQKVYGPLTINYPCNKWRWLEMPWPWERRVD